MQHALDRPSYESLFLLNNTMGKCEEGRRQILADQYPKNTLRAASELVTRGYKANAATLDYLVSKGIIRFRNGKGDQRQWWPEQIDAAAEHLDEIGSYTPETWRNVMDYTEAAQDIRAQREAFKRYPHLPPDTTFFVREVLPSVMALGIPAVVKYRPMNQAELAEWNERIAKAQEVAA